MEITIAKLLEDEGKSNLCVPMETKQAMPLLKVPLLKEAKETLSFFSDLLLDIGETQLPLEVYLLSGSTSRLALHPSQGGEIRVVVEKGKKMQLKGYAKWLDEAGHELLIFQKPFPSQT